MSLFISLNHLCNSISSNLCLTMLTVPTSVRCSFSQRISDLQNLKGGGGGGASIACGHICVSSYRVPVMKFFSWYLKREVLKRMLS